MATSSGTKSATNPGLLSKTIEDRLTRLPRGHGVWRVDLAGFLGTELCSRLHIVAKPQTAGQGPDSTEEVRAKVVWHLRRLVAGLEEDLRRSATIAFNISSHPELRTMNYDVRRNWGRENGVSGALRTVSDHMAKGVIPELVRELCRPQPIPLRRELEAIIAEFRGEAPTAIKPEPATSALDDDEATDVAELVAEVKERWTSPTAYNEFDLDTIEGVRNMYRQMMEEAAAAICLGGMSVDEVVAIMRSNKARPDISGHNIDEMAEQVAWSADRMQQIFDHETGAIAIYGRVIDEQGNLVEGVRQVAGSSIRRNKYGEVAGDGPNLISDSEIDAWMRGVLEYSAPADIAAGTLDAIRVLAHYMRVRLERSVTWQKQAEQAAAEQPNDKGANDALQYAERETKRQLAAVDALRHAMQQASPAKVRRLAEDVLWHDIDMAAAGYMNIEQLIKRFRDDKEFKQYRYGWS